MTTLESILVPALLFACVLFGVACAWGYEMREQRNEARARVKGREA